jgi:tricorn protease
VILRRIAGGLAVALGVWALAGPAGATEGYYRYPSLAGETVVFTAEGDLWSVPVSGGRASRLTTHPAEETNAVAAPDGKRIAFAASYDGPVETYVMPLSGGLPKRVSFDGSRAIPVGWTPAGEVLYVTQNQTGPSPELIVVAVNPETLQRHPIPLADASDAAVSPDGKTLYFTRFGLAFSGDNIEAYRGGLLARLWRYDLGGPAEAAPIGGPGKPDNDKDRVSDRRPMPWGDRLYFISDRDGHDNLWSMAPDGGDPRELTHATEFGVRGAALGGGRIVYQLGADIRVFDIAAGSDRKLDIDLTSDLDQERKHLVTKPLDFFENAELSPNGERGRGDRARSDRADGGGAAAPRRYRDPAGRPRRAGDRQRGRKVGLHDRRAGRLGNRQRHGRAADLAVPGGWQQIATGEILVENKGVEPDIAVDNPPHATFTGEDAQLDTAIRVLLDKLKAEPVPPL